MQWPSNQASHPHLHRWFRYSIPALCLTLVLGAVIGSVYSFPRSPSWVRKALESTHWQTDDPSSKYYRWATESHFNPTNFTNSRDRPQPELCAAFPSYLFDSIQPILKTGQSMLRQRLDAHLESVSACLSELLIFSDVEQYVAGHHVIDIIADIPAYLPHVWEKGEDHRDQFQPYDVLQQLKANGTLESTDLSNLGGWKTDKFKFLPGVSRAWEMRPNKLWYVFMEDDTYINWDNLLRLLTHFNPNEPWYFGDPSPGRRPARKQPKVWFANGGPGFILSRAAMLKLIKQSWSPGLIERWWNETLTNCCGDSILGWVLWNEDVLLSGLWPSLSAHRPSVTPFSEKFWCKPVVSMHRVKGEDMIDLWHWEWEHRQKERPILFKDIAESYLNFSALTTRQDWDNTGRGYHPAPRSNTYFSHDPHESLDACGRACDATTKCMTYTYRLRKCNFNPNIIYGEPREPELGELFKDLNKVESKMEWTRDEMRWQAGWSQKKIAQWMKDRPCEDVEWVRPSLDRVD